jgi:uncharacterized protein YbbK (DUF523 family)/uncharacterized protein YbgA (DUF1722 family)
MSDGETRTLRVGVSACLLGERVRYDGGHKRDAFLVEVLGKHVEWVPVCPEVELGLGVPRPPIDLVEADGTTRLLVTTTGEDLTDRMQAYAPWRAKGLASLALDGYVLKSRSPSCGRARGLFAQALGQAMPHVPMEEESRLRRASVRAHFVDRLFAAARWRDLTRRPLRAGDLVAFHAAHKYALLAHSPKHYETLGHLVATAGRRRLDDVVAQYGALFAAAYAVPATRARHADVLEQMAAFFLRALSDDERAELTTAIAAFRRGAAPLAEPMALVRAHVRTLGVAHLAEQVALRPHPTDLLS